MKFYNGIEELYSTVSDDEISDAVSVLVLLWQQQAQLKAARVQIYVRRGGPNYQKGLAKMRELGNEIGIPIEVSLRSSNRPVRLHAASL